VEEERAEQKKKKIMNDIRLMGKEETLARSTSQPSQRKGNFGVPWLPPQPIAPDFCVAREISSRSRRQQLKVLGAGRAIKRFLRGKEFRSLGIGSKYCLKGVQSMK
jgi:hypothetical protein